MGAAFKIQLASVPDRDQLVAEIWFAEQFVAELRQEDGRVRIQIYPNPTGEPWDFHYEALFAALQLAQARLAA